MGDRVCVGLVPYSRGFSHFFIALSDFGEIATTDTSYTLPYTNKSHKCNEKRQINESWKSTSKYKKKSIKTRSLDSAGITSQKKIGSDIKSLLTQIPHNELKMTSLSN